MVRKIIEINEDLCNGCGECVPNCAEGALKIIDGKARMISDLFCDGLGACIGHCPTGALKVIEREAQPYDEWRVMEKIVQGGANVIKEHLEHLSNHGEFGYLKTAREYLAVYGLEDPTGGEREAALKAAGRKATGSAASPAHGGFGGCPGSAMAKFGPKPQEERKPAAREEDFSELTHWPVQLHLVNPQAPYFRDTDLLLAADCTAFAAGNLHSRYLRGKSLAVACPKLDDGKDRYVQKLAAMMEEGGVRSITVLMMEVPCCGGLLQLVREAQGLTERKVPITAAIISVQGEWLGEQRIA